MESHSTTFLCKNIFKGWFYAANWCPLWDINYTYYMNLFHYNVQNMTSPCTNKIILIVKGITYKFLLISVLHEGGKVSSFLQNHFTPSTFSRLISFPHIPFRISIISRIVGFPQNKYLYNHLIVWLYFMNPTHICLQHKKYLMVWS